MAHTKNGTAYFESNPNLGTLEEDKLYHIGYSTDEDLAAIFGDVKFVCMGGSVSRMAKFAHFVQQSLGDVLDLDESTAASAPENISRTDRYAMYKVGPVLSVNHGMGFSSISILLHEIIKLLHYAGCNDPVIIRIGTSGGVGVKAGTVVVTQQPFNATMEPYHRQVVLGKEVHRMSRMHSDTLDKIMSASGKLGINVVAGNTMSTDDFYEGQGRIDGAVCQYDLEDKMEFLKKAEEKGIVNIEMECIVLGALCHACNVRCACVCVTLLDRLEGDQVSITKEEYERFQRYPQQVVLAYIRQLITPPPLEDVDEPVAKRAP